MCITRDLSSVNGAFLHRSSPRRAQSEQHQATSDDVRDRVECQQRNDAYAISENARHGRVEDEQVDRTTEYSAGSNHP